MKQITNPYLKSKVVRSTEGPEHNRNHNNHKQQQPQSQPQPNVRDATTAPHARNEIPLVKISTTHDHHKRFPLHQSGHDSVSSSTLSFLSKVTPSIVPVVSSSITNTLVVQRRRYHHRLVSLRRYCCAQRN
jgi:hypothetical protein